MIQACDAVFSNVKLRFCVKHLHSNWSTAGFRGFTVRKSLWPTAKASTYAHFSERVVKIAEIDVNAAKWLDDKPLSEWSRFEFKTFSKCDALLNNLYKSFDCKILEAGEQPMIAMFEIIRKYLMKRMEESRDRAKRKWKNKVLCPNILNRVEDNCNLAMLCIIYIANDENVEVLCPYGEQYAVNIREMSCSCRKWDLSGIPCIRTCNFSTLGNKQGIIEL